MKEKFKSYSFWMSVTAGVILVINNLGKVFGFAVKSETVTQIVDSICGVLILFGVLTMSKDEKAETENSNEETNNSDCEVNNQNQNDIQVESSKDANKKNADKEQED